MKKGTTKRLEEILLKQKLAEIRNIVLTSTAHLLRNGLYQVSSGDVAAGL